MLRVAGRSKEGMAKAIQTDEQGRIEIKPEELPGQIAESFTGEGNKDHVFKITMDGFVISNDGDQDISFYILDEEYLVKANEVFEGTFPSFRTVFIRGGSEFRAYGSSSRYSDQQKTHYFISDGVEISQSSSAYWKGTEAIAKKRVVLESFGAWGNPGELRIYKLNNGKLSKLEYTGKTFGNKDMRGFKSHVFTSDVSFDKGESFIVIVKYVNDSGGTSAFRYLNHSTRDDSLRDGEYLKDSILELGETRYNDAAEPQLNSDISGGNTLVYNHRIVVK